MMKSSCYALMIMAVSFGQRRTERAALLGIRILFYSAYFAAFAFSLVDEAKGLFLSNHQSLIKLLSTRAHSPGRNTSTVYDFMHVLCVFLEPGRSRESLSACKFCRVTVHIDNPEAASRAVWRIRRNAG